MAAGLLNLVMLFSAPFTEENIKRQFRDMSKQFHPDKGGDRDKFELMKYEYEVISTVLKSQPRKVVVVRRNASPFSSEINQLIIKGIRKLKDEL